MKKGQLDSHILVLVTLGLTAFGLVMVYSATSAPAALGGRRPGLLSQARGHLRADRRRAADGRVANRLPRSPLPRAAC